MTSQLSLYNGALRLCEERRLATVTENREPRHLLDDAYGDGATGGSVKRCLEMGQWTWATRSVEIAADPGIDPDFGYDYAFTKPEDLVRITGIYSNAKMTEPLLTYRDEAGVWYAPIDTMWISYVSNDAAFGTDMGKWPENFVELVEAHLAMSIVGVLTEKDSIKKSVAAALKAAKLAAPSFDAMNKPTQFPPESGWNRARRGYGSNYRSSMWNGETS